jgi:hypothetical protein
MKYDSKEYHEARKKFESLSKEEQEKINKQGKEIKDWFEKRLMFLQKNIDNK